MDEIEFDVTGLPPAKSEAMSMLGATHAHAPRVRVLLEAARAAVAGTTFQPLTGPIGLEVTVCAPNGHDAISDATNYLGGIADVLQDKSHLKQHPTMKIDLPSELMQVALYDNDKRVEEIRYHMERGPNAGYRVHVWRLPRA